MFLCPFVLKVTQSAFSCSKTKNTKQIFKVNNNDIRKKSANSF